MSAPITLVWLRRNLRLHDHAALYHAAKRGGVLAVYCFDPREYGKTHLGGYPKTGAFRAQFLLESLQDVQEQLEAKGVQLVIRRGKPEVELPKLAAELGADALYYQAEHTSEELVVERALKVALHEAVALRAFEELTLIHPEELPFPVESMPGVFTDFRKKVEQYCMPHAPLPVPSFAATQPRVQAGGALPSLQDLDLEAPPVDDRAAIVFKGGEQAALARLEHYLWGSNALASYKQTRNGMRGPDYSSKFSPWLALGCLSPRAIYAEVKRYEAERTRNESTYWLLFELLWRDFFRYQAMCHGNAIFKLRGIRQLVLPWRRPHMEPEPAERLAAWQQGQTGVPLIDANMQELLHTGFISNRGRQIVASFLTKYLSIDWRWGAAWFESQLIDYDAASNWGNWAYLAGVGSDPRGFRYFNPSTQAEKYDPDGSYVKHWLSPLDGLPDRYVHHPWHMPEAERAGRSFELGRDYPEPLIDLDEAIEAAQAAYEAAVNDPMAHKGNYKLKRFRRKRKF